jgi:hypothetical protein
MKRLERRIHKLRCSKKCLSPLCCAVHSAVPDPSCGDGGNAYVPTGRPKQAGDARVASAGVQATAEIREWVSHFCQRTSERICGSLFLGWRCRMGPNVRDPLSLARGRVEEAGWKGERKHTCCWISGHVNHKHGLRFEADGDRRLRSMLHMATSWRSRNN